MVEFDIAIPPTVETALVEDEQYPVPIAAALLDRAVTTELTIRSEFRRVLLDDE
jgi:hypothetical protein